MEKIKIDFDGIDKKEIVLKTFEQKPVIVDFVTGDGEEERISGVLLYAGEYNEGIQVFVTDFKFFGQCAIPWEDIICLSKPVIN